jgi:tetratricopeptide (TPR) repeat protein
MSPGPRPVNFAPWLAGVLSLACAASAAAGGNAPLPPSDHNLAAEGYAVAPFENTSPVKTLDWMCSALAITVAEKLEALPNLRPTYGPAVLDGFSYAFDPEKVARRAHDLGAKWVIGGAVGRPNWKAEVKVRVYAVVEPSNTVANFTLRLVAESGSVGERDRLLDLLDANLVAVLDKMGWTPDADAMAQVKRRPSHDLYAFTLYGRALNLYLGLAGARDLDKAIPLLKKVNLIEPKLAEAHRILGLVYLDQGDRARASSQISYALDLRPGYFAALYGLARLYRADNNRARAQEMIEKALEARPYDIDAREMLGELLWENAQLDEALAELEKVIALQPKNLPARRTLALIYAAKGDTIDLAAELERVQDLSPDDLDVRLDLASAYLRMGANDKAIDAYEEVLKRQPKSIQALKFLGDCYRRKGEPERAIAAYQRALKLNPEDPRPYFLLGAAYTEAGQEAKAEQIFQDAQQFKRYLGEAWTNLGSIAFRRGDLSKASWYLSRAVVRSPSRPKAHYNYALLLDAKKERDKALDELRLAGDLDPQDAEIRYLAGVILLRLGRLDEAKNQFAEALKRRPDHADAKHNLALLEDLERRYGGEHSGTGSK